MTYLIKCAIEVSRNHICLKELMPPLMEERRRNQQWRHVEKGANLSILNMTHL
jgi:hypothetical protein